MSLHVSSASRTKNASTSANRWASVSRAIRPQWKRLMPTASVERQNVKASSVRLSKRKKRRRQQKKLLRNPSSPPRSRRHRGPRPPMLPLKRPLPQPLLLLPHRQRQRLLLPLKLPKLRLRWPKPLLLRPLLLQLHLPPQRLRPPPKRRRQHHLRPPRHQRHLVVSLPPLVVRAPPGRLRPPRPRRRRRRPLGSMPRPHLPRHQRRPQRQLPRPRRRRAPAVGPTPSRFRPALPESRSRHRHHRGRSPASPFRPRPAVVAGPALTAVQLRAAAHVPVRPVRLPAEAAAHDPAAVVPVSVVARSADPVVARAVVVVAVSKSCSRSMSRPTAPRTHRCPRAPSWSNGTRLRRSSARS